MLLDILEGEGSCLEMIGRWMAPKLYIPDRKTNEAENDLD